MMTLHLQFHAWVKQFDGNCSQQLSTFAACEALIEIFGGAAEAAPLWIKHVLSSKAVSGGLLDILDEIGFANKFDH